MPELLETSALWAGYGDLDVVRDVDLAVHQGQCVGLIGPNGHGKTTLLHAISGLIRPSSGSISFDGSDVTRVPAYRRARRGLVHIPQGDLLFGELTVEDNLLAAAQGEQWRRRTELLSSAYALFPILDERRGQLAGTMSGGQRRMLAIARGLMMRAELILVDEPSLGLAPRVVSDVYGALRELLASGIALLIVEENPDRLRELVDETFLLEAGTIVKRGSFEEILADEQLVKTYFGAGTSDSPASTPAP
jgi:branched-chain amino acid transport system ATP-binding protein